MTVFGTRRIPGFVLTAAVAAATPLDAAHAYVGPGLGLGSLAVVLGVIGSIFLALFAVIWYPIKRLIKKHRAPKAGEEKQPEH